MEQRNSIKKGRLHAVRDGIVRARDLQKEERASRPSVAEWYAGRSVFMTGGSGFMGRVLIELLLRSCPDIGHVYILLRPKKGVDPADRLAALLDVPLFDRLRAEQPNALSKVKTVAGDIEASSLGVSAAERDHLCREVSVVFHVAASVRFDDPFRKAVLTNLRSTRDVVQLARDMPKLKALVHVSTAYAFTNQNPIDECVYPTQMDWREALRYADLPDNDQAAIDILEAKLRDWQPNTYTLTKSLAEHLMEEASKHLPVIITRPSIVMNSFRDPLPGWIDNLNGQTGFLVANMKGLLRVIRGYECPFDSVPVDVAAKVIVLASWSKGLGLQLSDQEVDVVNATVGNDFGLMCDEMFYTGLKHGLQYEVPYPGAIRVPCLRYEPCPFMYAVLQFYQHLLFGFIFDLVARATGEKPRLLNLYRKAQSGLDATTPFRKTFSFKMENQRKLQRMIHPSDLKTLDYLHIYNSRDDDQEICKNIKFQLRGALLYALKEEDDAEKNTARLKRVEWIMYAYHSFMAILFFGILAFLCKLL